MSDLELRAYEAGVAAERARVAPIITDAVRVLSALAFDAPEDVAAVEALAVVAEAAVAWELAVSAHEKFGGDAVQDFVAAHRAYVERIQWR